MPISIRVTAFFCVGILALAPVFSLQAQDAGSLTPEESIEMALEQHGLIQRAESEAQEARAAFRMARASWFPTIRTQASYTRLSDNIPPIQAEFPGIDTTFTIAPVELNRYHAEISLEQPLFAGTRLINQARAAEHRADAAEEAIEREQASVALDVRRAYWTLYQAQHQRDALESSLEQVEAHLQNVQHQVDEGAALRTHLLAAQTRRSEVQLDLIEAENATRSAQLELNQLTGLGRGTEVTLEPVVALYPIAESREELIEEALADHPEINALRSQVQAQESEVRVASRAWLPEAALTGRYMYARPNQYFFAEQDRFRPTWEAGVVLRWDVWDGGRRGAQTDQAEARLQSERATLEHAEEQIEMEVTRQYLAAEGARRAVEVAQETVAEAEESFRVVEQQFEAGAVLSADVLEAEAALRSAQAREGDAMATYAMSRAALLNALGRVWE